MNADISRKVVTQIRHEYAVESPISAVEMGKVIALVTGDARDRLGSIDDLTVQIKSYDGEVVLYWTEEQSSS